MATALDVAMHIRRAHQLLTGTVPTSLHVQKLLYFVHGELLSITGSGAFSDHVQAWKHGPVVKSVYVAFRHEPMSQSLPLRPISRDVMTAIQSVVEMYQGLSASALRNITHQPGSAWSQVYNPDFKNIVIPDDLICQEALNRRAQQALSKIITEDRRLLELLAL